MKIITTPDSRLREKSEKVGKITPEVLEIIEKMPEKDLRHEAKGLKEAEEDMSIAEMLHDNEVLAGGKIIG